MLLLVLAVLWGIVLIPPVWRAYSERRRARSLDRFRRTLQVLAPAEVPRAVRPPDAARPAGAARSHVALIASERPAPAPTGLPVVRPSSALPAAPPARRPKAAAAAVGPRTRAQVLRRRRLVLAALAVAAPVSALAAVLAGHWAVWALHAATGLALAAYTTGLRRLRRLAAERRVKVRYLPAPSSGAAPAMDVADPAGTDAEAPLRSASASS